MQGVPGQPEVPIIATSEATPGKVHRIGNQLTHGRCQTIMKFFDSWWQRVPVTVKAGLIGTSLVAMVLGGHAGQFWQ